MCSKDGKDSKTGSGDKCSSNVQLMEKFNGDWEVEVEVEVEVEWKRAKITLAVAYSIIAYCGGSVWGHEVFLVDLYGLQKYMWEVDTMNKEVCDDTITGTV